MSGENRTEVSDILSLVPTQLYVCSLLPYLYNLELELKNAVKEPLDGVYMLNDPDPILKPGVMYYTRTSVIDGVPVSDLSNIDTCIIDGDGKVIIPTTVMRKKDKLLSNTPKVFSRGIYILELAVHEYFQNTLPYARNVITANIEDHLKDGYKEIHSEGTILELCDPLFLEIQKFVGKDRWFIYFIKRVGTDLYIEKACDYRVYQWTKAQYEKEEEDVF